MSRMLRYAKAVFSGYVLLAATVVYSLASVPLVLNYLNREEFGLWALTTQLVGFLSLLDMGMSASITRILIDYKDRPDDGQYGAVVKAAFVISLLQGGVIALVGVGLAFLGGVLFHVPAELSREYAWLMGGQAGITCLMFVVRVPAQLLVVHQRYDVFNAVLIVSLLANYLALWGGFAAHLGFMSILSAMLFSQTVTGAAHWLGCASLGLFPSRGQWGRFSGRILKELIILSKDVALFNFGMQLINSSQMVILSRQVGLEAVGVWSVCARVYTLASTAIYRLFDYSYPAFCEMLVRGEKDRLQSRFKDLTRFTLGIAVLASVMIALCNRSFVSVWTTGRFAWPLSCDILLGCMLIVGVIVRLHSGLVGVTKRFMFLRYVFLLEGALFCGSALIASRHYGITGLQAASLLSTLLLSAPYALRRTAEAFHLSIRTVVWSWNERSVKFLAAFFVPAAAIGWLTISLAPLDTFLWRGVAGGLIGLMLFIALVLYRSERAGAWSCALTAWRKVNAIFWKEA